MKNVCSTLLYLFYKCMPCALCTGDIGFDRLERFNFEEHCHIDPEMDMKIELKFING